MKKNVIFLSTISLMLFFTSCQKENIENEANIQFANVDQELWSFYRSFEIEANLRGFNYDLNAMQISGVIEEIHEDNVAGSCRFGNHINNAVTIDQEFWSRSSDLFKEFVVFHELGHCVLLRDHDESADANGRCLSIMRSGTTNCRDSYSFQTRDRFIDELFLQN